MARAARRSIGHGAQAPSLSLVPAPRIAALPYPAEAPPLDTAEQVIDAWALAFLPPLVRGDLDRINLFVSRADVLAEWLPWGYRGKHRPPRSLTVDAAREAIGAHLAAGETGIPWSCTNEGDLRAIAAHFRPDEPSWILNVDLDGRDIDGREYKPGEILAALASIGARPLVTSGSGRPGRYRALLRLDRWYAVDEIQAFGRRVFAALGFEPRDGGIELYPRPTCTRLPFGLGGCTTFDAADLARSTKAAPAALIRTFYELPPFALESIAASLAPSSPNVEPSPHVEPNVEPPQPLHVEPRVEPSPPRPKGRRTAGEAPAHVRRWIDRGVEPGERQKALVALAIHAWIRGMSEGEAAMWIQDWIRNGGIDRSRFVAEHRDGRERAIRDSRRTVENVYRICSSWQGQEKRGKRVNAPKANPSAADVLSLAPHVERVAAELAIPVARVGSFLLAILPYFKGAAIARHVDAWERPIARIHWSIMHAATGDDYARIRDAFGLFEEHEGYLPASRAKRPEDAKARTYALTLPLSADAPKRPLASTWEGSLWMASRKARRVPSSDVGNSP